MKILIAPLAAFALTLSLSSCAITQKGETTVQQKFASYDLNDDGKISPQEYAEVATRIVFIAFDENEDGSVTLAEWQNLEGNDANSHFTSHDPNKDGKVTLDEALATTKKHKSFSQDFPGIDADRDGYVTLPEAEAYAAKIRAGLKKQ